MRRALKAVACILLLSIWGTNARADDYETLLESLATPVQPRRAPFRVFLEIRQRDDQRPLSFSVGAAATGDQALNERTCKNLLGKLCVSDGHHARSRFMEL
jgi:hypothetical protein